MSSSSSTSKVEEFVRREVEDWDDEVISTARFKAFSGQRSDWEPKLHFWRDLITKVARHLGKFTVRSSEVKNVWFARGGLTPLCMDQVLQEMCVSGDILSKGGLVDPTSGRMYSMLRRVQQIIVKFGSFSLQESADDTLILKTLLEEKACDIIKTLSESNWTSTCIITMEKFRNICKGSAEASAILSYLCGCGKARYFSIRKDDFIEGVKLSLVPASCPDLSSLDYHSLHLIWTVEKLQQQLDVIDQRWETSRKLALASIKSGNKQAAYRHIRQSKLFSESRDKCTSLLERVEEVLRIIADAESTKKVSEAIKIGAQVIKENKITVEEVHVHLQELDESITAQKQVNEALEAMPLQFVDLEDEDVEDEFKKLEMELADEEMPRPPIHEPLSDKEEIKKAQDPAESLSKSLSNLNLEPEAA
ncbi:uncharacterized protein A4U43_C07F10640 [Asparagus officinalis]|uniref:Charged multivesicular body protein 7 n=1 Tax=Asparagus officinalis TaxID=4686 RepID=A0A5P1ECU5_ASPOF|nr:charged multivesicular body protein 7 [Asparagus officinalis]ONK63027.1 uncharacterized protein A4U43_C07F10640 [Asparagus officinalis]